MTIMETPTKEKAHQHKNQLFAAAEQEESPDRAAGESVLNEVRISFHLTTIAGGLTQHCSRQPRLYSRTR